MTFIGAEGHSVTNSFANISTMFTVLETWKWILN